MPDHGTLADKAPAPLEDELMKLRAERDTLAAALDHAKTILEWVSLCTFWVSDDEWQSTQPEQDDEREWTDYSAWASTLTIQLAAPAAILAAVRCRAKAEGLTEAAERWADASYPTTTAAVRIALLKHAEQVYTDGDG